MHRAIIRFRILMRQALPWRKPLYIMRLLYSAIRVYIFRSNLLRGTDFSIGYLCNLKCKHCFTTSLAWGRGRPTMSVEDYSRVSGESMRLGCIAFSIQGGEPLLYPELETIIKALRPRWNRIPIATNATLLTRERMLLLKRAGVDTINVSLDSGKPEEHDRFRGVPGTYYKAMRALEEALSMGFAVSINMTLPRTALYSDGFKKLLEFAHKKKIVINTLFAAPAGNWMKSQHFLMRPEDIAYYNKLREAYPFMMRDLDSNFGPRGCGAVHEMLYITCYGDVLACPFIHISLGNVLEEPLAIIRARGLSTYLFKRYHPKCWIAEEQEFIKAYVNLMSDKDRLPVRWDSPEGKTLLYDFRLGRHESPGAHDRH